MRRRELGFLLGGSLLGAGASAQGVQRRDVRFQSQGVHCAGWYYLPADHHRGERRPAIAMAPDYGAMKEMQLDAVASAFAAAGLALLLFDYRCTGASEGEPRQSLLWWDQITDYRNALTWLGLQPEVDARRLGAWGTGYSGGHVLQLAAFDRRVQCVVAQTPMTHAWEAFYADLAPKELEQLSAVHAQARAMRMTTGEIDMLPIVSGADGTGVFRQPEARAWYEQAALRAPRWVNRVTLETTEAFAQYEPAAAIARIAPTPLLMVVAKDDDITPVGLQLQAFAKAGQPKQWVELPGGHYAPFDAARQAEFLAPQVAWFAKHLPRRG